MQIARAPRYVDLPRLADLVAAKVHAARLALPLGGWRGALPARPDKSPGFLAPPPNPYCLLGPDAKRGSSATSSLVLRGPPSRHPGVRSHLRDALCPALPASLRRFFVPGLSLFSPRAAVLRSAWAGCCDLLTALPTARKAASPAACAARSPLTSTQDPPRHLPVRRSQGWTRRPGQVHGFRLEATAARLDRSLYLGPEA